VVKDEVIVYSVPHTGTHFVRRFLDALGRESIQFHADSVNLTKVHQAKESLAVVPFRHPYKVLISHFQRNDSLRHLGWQGVMTKVQAHYDFLMRTVDLLDYEVLQMDCLEKDRLGNLARVAKHVGRDENNGQLLLRWASDWPIMGWHKYRYPIPTDIDWGQLDYVLEWTGYDPLDMKDFVHPQGSDNYKVDVHRGGGINMLAPQVVAKGKATVRRPDGSVKLAEVN